MRQKGENDSPAEADSIHVQGLVRQWKILQHSKRKQKAERQCEKMNI
jgi:hypothetical protein